MVIQESERGNLCTFRLLKETETYHYLQGAFEFENKWKPLGRVCNEKCKKVKE